MCTPSMRVDLWVRKINMLWQCCIRGLYLHLRVGACAFVLRVHVVDIWTLSEALLVYVLKASDLQKEFEGRFDSPLILHSWLPSCLGIVWVELGDPGPQWEAPEGPRERETRTGHRLPPMLNIASACLAWPIKNTENSANRQQGGGTCEYAQIRTVYSVVKLLRGKLGICDQVRGRFVVGMGVI